MQVFYIDFPAFSAFFAGVAAAAFFLPCRSLKFPLAFTLHKHKKSSQQRCELWIIK
jgi:hypothetical protein